MHDPSPRTLLLTWMSLATLATAGAAQQVVVRIGGAIATPEAQEEVGEGPAVEMFESPNLDRFLRRARQFLVEEKFKEAILVLQAVVEGRTLEAHDTAGGDPPAEPLPAGEPPPQEGAARELADPAQTVFSADGRIYRPARRLCQEYLAGMPAAGLELYRILYERPAQDLLEAALAGGGISDLEQVANRYFPTLAGGRAMQALADRQMHEGRFRAAVQVLRDLAELYPAAQLRQLGVTPLWCRFKIALCLRLAGEHDAAREAATRIATDHPDESLRIMGELQPVAELPSHSLFAASTDELAVDTPRGRADGEITWLTTATTELVPLWQYRFAGPDPYAAVAASNEGRSIFVGFEGGTVVTAPPASKYGTGTQVAFLGRGRRPPDAVFFENYRLRIADAFTGVIGAEGDGEAMPNKPLEMRARARVPVYDFALLTPVEDEVRYYAVLGRNKIDSSIDSLKVNTLVAYDKQTARRLWSSETFGEGDDGLAAVTFLAAPTVFGERLLVPTLREGIYQLQCLDRRTGRPLWHTGVHSGGSDYFRAPGARVQIAGNIAFMLTNAGAVAAIDAFAGDLRWVRKCERTDPLRQRPIARRGGSQGGMWGNVVAFVERDLPSYLPSDLFVIGGTVLFAGCDSDMLLCLDGASGEPVWMVDGSTRYVPYGRLRYLVGCNDRFLYAAAELEGRTSLVCIEHASGVIRWAREVPGGSDRLTRWRGRGCVTAQFVCMPGDREVLVIDSEGRDEWRRLPLPSFGLGDEPLRGSNNLYCAGPWLGIAYAGGVEVYSTAAVLRDLAAASQQPLERAALLVQAGDVEQALGTIEAWLRGEVADAAQRRRGETRLLELARELALSATENGVALLDRVRSALTTRESRQNWHLARLDLFRRMHDLHAYSIEQQHLYELLEGKR